MNVRTAIQRRREDEEDGLRWNMGQEGDDHGNLQRRDGEAMVKLFRLMAELLPSDGCHGDSALCGCVLLLGRITKKGAEGAFIRILNSVCLVKSLQGGNCPLAGNSAPSAAIDSFLTP